MKTHHGFAVNLLIKTFLVSIAMVLTAPCDGQSERKCLGTAFINTIGGSVEIIGLRNWTFDMIRDSIQLASPGLEIGDAACGEVLRSRFGFPEAGVLQFSDGRTVITIVEPVDSDNVKLREIPSEREGLIEDWASFRKLMDEDFIGVDFAVSTYFDQESHDNLPNEFNTETIRESRGFLSGRKNSKDLHLALETISMDKDVEDRMVAVNILLNFHDQDICWHALVKALRDPDWGVRGQALGILRKLRESCSRTIDWSPASEDLSYLLGGTTMVYHTELIKTLLTTKVSNKLAPALLDKGGELIIAELSAHHECLSSAKPGQLIA